MPSMIIMGLFNCKGVLPGGPCRNHSALEISADSATHGPRSALRFRTSAASCSTTATAGLCKCPAHRELLFKEDLPMHSLDGGLGLLLRLILNESVALDEPC